MTSSLQKWHLGHFCFPPWRQAQVELVYMATSMEPLTPVLHLRFIVKIYKLDGTPQKGGAEHSGGTRGSLSSGGGAGGGWAEQWQGDDTVLWPGRAPTDPPPRTPGSAERKRNLPFERICFFPKRRLTVSRSLLSGGVTSRSESATW